MAVREILCERMGENITTSPSPVRAWRPDDLPLLQVKEQYCSSYDDNRLVSGNRYARQTVDLPDWLDTDVWCQNYLRWQRLLANKNLVAKFGPDSGRFIDYDEKQQRALDDLCKVKQFKSEFRKSLFDQLAAWVTAERPEHPSPFSPRQWAALTRYLH